MITRLLVRRGSLEEIDLLLNEVGMANDSLLFLIGSGTVDDPMKVPTSKSTGEFAYDENLLFTGIQIGGGSINNSAIGNTAPSTGVFSGVSMEWWATNEAEEYAQSESNNPILKWRSVAVDHDQNINANIDTTTYGFVERESLADGGFKLHGLSSAINALNLVGWAPNANISTTKSASARAVVEFTAKSTIAGDQAALTGNANAFAWKVSTDEGEIAIGFLTADGDLHLDGSATVTLFDDYEDHKLVGGLRMMMMPKTEEGDVMREKFQHLLDYAAPVMIQYGIISVCDQTGKVFINSKKALYLVFDAIRQMGDKMSEMMQRISALEAKA